MSRGLWCAPRHSTHGHFCWSHWLGIGAIGLVDWSTGGGSPPKATRPAVQGYLAHKKPQPPLGTPRGICLLQGPRGWRFLMSEVPLKLGARVPAPAPELSLQKVFIRSFYKSQFPLKSVNLIFTIAMVSICAHLCRLELACVLLVCI